MFKFGKPEILKINFVLKLKILNIKIGKDDIKWLIKYFGFFFLLIKLMEKMKLKILINK